MTPSHNPPADGGFKYDPPSGGPADSATTSADLPDAANALLVDGVGRVRRSIGEHARAGAVEQHDYIGGYVDDLPSVVDIAAIAASGLRIGVDPLGGASIAYWGAIADRHEMPLVITNLSIDPRFGFMTVDWDGRLPGWTRPRPTRWRDSIDMRTDFDLALGNDADADRFGVVTPSGGLDRPEPPPRDRGRLPVRRRARVVGRGGRRQDARVVEHDRSRDGVARAQAVPRSPSASVVVDGLLDGSVGFGGEESAGLSCSCAAMAARGALTRTASSRACSPRR